MTILYFLFSFRTRPQAHYLLHKFDRCRFGPRDLVCILCGIESVTPLNHEIDTHGTPRNQYARSASALSRALKKHKANCNSEQALFDGFVQERRNSSALAMELRLSCTNPSIYARCLVFSKHSVILILKFHKITACYLHVYFRTCLLVFFDLWSIDFVVVLLFHLIPWFKNTNGYNEVTCDSAFVKLIHCNILFSYGEWRC